MNKEDLEGKKKPKLTPDQKLFREYLKLAKRFNITSSWFNIKRPINKGEHLVNKIRCFVNKNPRLKAKYSALLSKDTKGMLESFRVEVLRAQAMHRIKKAGVLRKENE